MSTTSDETFAEQAAERLVNDILYGVLAPGQKLRMEALKAQYGIGASPIREALARLTSLGFVTASSHRGFRVSEMSRADLEDITVVRHVVECAMVEQAIACGDDEWEVGIIAAFARLSRAVAGSDTAGPVPFRAFEVSHKQFHRALLAACPSPRLAQIQDVSFDQSFRYRDLMFKTLGDGADFLRNHERLMQDVLSRDVARATAALRAHLSQTIALAYGPAPTTPAS